ncbi:metallophosphoesterase [Pseudomonas chlororaphis]|nr:metallophosphoesterase [Pseudomonas chlororaphis]
MLIAQVTDIHIGISGECPTSGIANIQRLADTFSELSKLQQQPDLIVFTGDITESGSVAEYQAFAGLLPLDIPYMVLPGNHDLNENMRLVFGVGGAVGNSCLLERDGAALLIVGLDSSVHGESYGFLAEDELCRLAATLCEYPSIPTVLALHHPPIKCGVEGLDNIKLINSVELAGVIAPHRQVLGIMAGHYHRAIFSTWSSRAVTVCPSVARPLALNLVAGDICYSDGAPNFMLHRWDGECLVSAVMEVGQGASMR